MDNIELTIRNGQTLYYPCIEEGVTWETERKSYPGKLSFNVLTDDILKIEEGNMVNLKFGNANANMELLESSLRIRHATF